MTINEEKLPDSDLRLRSIHTERTGPETSDGFIWKERVEKSLLY